MTSNRVHVSVLVCNSESVSQNFNKEALHFRIVVVFVFLKVKSSSIRNVVGDDFDDIQISNLCTFFICSFSTKQ